MLFDVLFNPLLLLYLQMDYQLHTGKHSTYVGNGSFSLCDWLDTEFVAL